MRAARVVLALILAAASSAARADTLALPHLGVTITVPPGWSLMPADESDQLHSDEGLVQFERMSKWPTCREFLASAAAAVGGVQAAGPAYLVAPYATQVVVAPKAPSALVGCFDSPGGPVAAVFTRAAPDVDGILSAVAAAVTLAPAAGGPASPRTLWLPTSQVTVTLPAVGFDRWSAGPKTYQGGVLDGLDRAGAPELSLLLITSPAGAAAAPCGPLLAKAGTPTAAPSFVPAGYATQVTELTRVGGRAVLVCAEVPAPLLVLVTMEPGVGRGDEAALATVLAAIRLAFAPAPVAPTPAPTVVPPAVAAPPPPTVVAPPPPPTVVAPPLPPTVAATPSTADSPSRVGRWLSARRPPLLGFGYDTVTPATMSGLATSHYAVVQISESHSFRGGDLVGGVTLGYGDQAAYDVQLNVGPTRELLGVQLSALIGLGYDAVDGTAMQFALAGGTYIQFLGRAAVDVGPLSLTASYAVSNRETRAAADLVLRLPVRHVPTIAMGVRSTDYELASRTGVMLTLGF